MRLKTVCLKMKRDSSRGVLAQKKLELITSDEQTPTCHSNSV